MLTDIFAYRYEKRVLWEEFGDREARLLVQCFRNVEEQVLPYWTSDGKEDEKAKAKWKWLHDRLCMELGKEHLSPPVFLQGDRKTPHFWSMDYVCKTFVCAPYAPAYGSPDKFVKERLSFIELAFRLREEEIKKLNQDLPSALTAAELADKRLSPAMRLVVPGSQVAGAKAWNATVNRLFRAAVDELNERLRRAGAPLNYHSGFLQIAEDELTNSQISHSRRVR